MSARVIVSAGQAEDTLTVTVNLAAGLPRPWGRRALGCRHGIEVRVVEPLGTTDAARLATMAG